MKLLVSGKVDLEKEYEIVFLFAALPYFSWVAEILATDNFEINVFCSKGRATFFRSSHCPISVWTFSCILLKSEGTFL